MKPSKRILSLKESETLALSSKVRELNAAGHDIVGLTLGEPDFDTPDNIREAAIQAIKDGYTHYPPVSGFPDLRETIANKFKRENNIDYAPENIVVSTGAKQSLVNVVMSVVDPGDEVILPAPYWVSYLQMVELAGGTPVSISTGVHNGFKISPESLKSALNHKTKLLFLNSPSNPSGAIYSQEELESLCEVLKEYPDVLVISDEIYEYIIYNGKHFSIASLPHMKDRVATINGVSKGYAMTGWRLGYMGAPLWLAKLCNKFQGQVTSGANTIAQKAAVAALNSPPAQREKMTEVFRQRRDFIYDHLKDIKGVQTLVPDGAFYFYPDFSSYFGTQTPEGNKIMDIVGLSDYLLYEEGLALIPGSAFGTDNHLRISYAYSHKQLEIAMERLKEGLGRLS